MTLDEIRGRTTLTVEEAAEALHVSRGVAYESVRRGELPSLKLGRRVLVPVPKLLALLGAGESEPPEAG